MGGEWLELRVEDFAEVVGGGTPSTKVEANFNGKISWITPKDLSGYPFRYISRGERNISERGLANSNARLLPAGSVLLTTRAPVGYVAIAANPLTTNQGFHSLVPKDGFSSEFIYYLLKANTEYLKSNASGTTFGELSGRVLKKLVFSIAPLPEQCAIAHILGMLDDKIELNRRMNRTLEEMARAIFKSWFVDFDPVRAKAAVRREHPDWSNAQVSRAACPTLKPEIAELFPDEFENSELGEIPKGWKVGCVDDEFDLTMGQSPPGETYNENGEGLPFYQGRADFGSRFPRRRVYCTAPTRLARACDTLISVRAPVGDINMALEDCAIGRGVAAARHKTGSRSYSFQFMRGLEEIFARFEAEGTVFGSIGKKDFHAIPCVRPPREVVCAFETMLLPIDSRIEVTERESVTLAALRDALLPKLISGELRLPAAVRDRAAQAGGKDAERFLNHRGEL